MKLELKLSNGRGCRRFSRMGFLVEAPPTRRRRKRAAKALTALGLVVSSGCFASGSPVSEGARSTPASWVVGSYQPRTHSHNDYERNDPLWFALAHGFASIEVDVALHEGTFYVTHDPSELDPGRTLAGMYLDPLRAIARSRGGRIYPHPAEPLQLLVDIKSDGARDHLVLERLLDTYDGLLTRWTLDATEPGAVSVVVSGHPERARFAARDERWIALDGRLTDLGAGFARSSMPIVSIDWEDLGGSSDRFERALARIQEVQAQGRRVRFWGVPDDAAHWEWLRAANVDYIGTDDVRGLTEFLAGEAEGG